MLNLFEVFLACMFITSLILSFVSESDAHNFSGAICGFFVSFIMALEIRFYRREPKTFGPSNPVKGMFYALGKPKGYRNMCICILVVFLCLGIYCFVNDIFALTL